MTFLRHKSGDSFQKPHFLVPAVELKKDHFGGSHFSALHGHASWNHDPQFCGVCFGNNKGSLENHDIVSGHHCHQMAILPVKLGIMAAQIRNNLPGFRLFRLSKTSKNTCQPLEELPNILNYQGIIEGSWWLRIP